MCKWCLRPMLSYCTVRQDTSENCRYLQPLCAQHLYTSPATCVNGAVGLFISRCPYKEDGKGNLASACSSTAYRGSGKTELARYMAENLANSVLCLSIASCPQPSSTSSLPFKPKRTTTPPNVWALLITINDLIVNSNVTNTSINTIITNHFPELFLSILCSHQEK